MKIVEGLHIEEVVHLKVYIGFDPKFGDWPVEENRVKSLIWQPHGDNWMAGEIMRALQKEKDNE